MPAIPERVWALLTPSEKEELQAVVDGWRFQPTFRCPKCEAEVTVRVRLTFGAVGLDAREKTPPAKSAPVDAVDARFLEAARTSGLFDAFKSAVMAERDHAGVPGDLDEFFLLFWRLAAPIKVSAVILAAWKMEFEGFIEVYQSNGIIAVLSNGELVAFVPNRFTQAAAASGTGPQPRISTAASFEMWTKSKYGYVPMGARSFGAALKQRNIGKFGAIVQ